MAIALKRSVCAGLAALPVAVGLVGSVYQRFAERRDNRRFPPLGELADIGNRRLHVLDPVPADLSWSSWPRTPAAMADELDALLTRLRINQPIILAGHSMGGLAVRLYAARHRERVAHLVLVDSSHEDQDYVLPQFEPTENVRDLWARAVWWQARSLGLCRLRVALGALPDSRSVCRGELCDMRVPPRSADRWLHRVNRSRALR